MGSWSDFFWGLTGQPRQWFRVGNEEQDKMGLGWKLKERLNNMDFEGNAVQYTAT